jgi:hypothetical protein
MADLVTPISPMEMQIQQQAIDRQRQLALALQQSSLQAPEGQMVSGHYVGPSATQYISKLAQGLIGKNQQSDLDQKQLDLAKQYNNNLMGVAQALIGGGQGAQTPQVQQPAPSQGDVASAALGAGAQTGSVGPTNDNASRMDAINTQISQQPQAPQQPSVNPLFKGMSPALLTAYLQQPDSAFGKIASVQIQTNAKAMEPTDLIKTMVAAGIDPKSPQGQQILQGNIDKTNYVAPPNVREGATVLDWRTNKPIFNAPNKEGFQYKYDVNGNATAAPVPGAAAAIGAAEEAKAGAKANYQVQTGVDANGNPIFTTAGAVARGVNGNAGTTLAQNTEPFKGANLLAQLPPNVRAGILESAKADPSGRFSLNYQLPNGQRIVGDIDLNSGSAPVNSATAGGVRPAAPPGYAEGQTVMGTANAKGYQDLKAQAAGAADRMNALDNILDLANGGTKYAPGTSARIEKLSSLNSLLPPGMAFGNSDVANAQVMQKWASNLAGQYMKALGGTGTDAQLENSLKSIANPDMMNDAIKEVVPKLKAMEAAVQAKANAYDQWLSQPGNSVDKGNLFENQFRKVYDPRIFQLNMMTPDQKRDYIGKLSPEDAGVLLGKRQQLRTMGAF